MSQEAETTDAAEVINATAEQEIIATHAEAQHEVTLSAEPVFNVGSFSITNSLVNSWLVVFIIVVISVIISRKLKKVPQGIQNIFEMIIEGAMKLADSVTGDRHKTQKIFPIVFSIFIFILLNNWLGIIPGIGSIGFIEEAHGQSIFVPYFRGATADLNTTLALAIFAVLGANIFGIFTIGAWRHFNKFINLKSLAEVPVKVRKEPTIVFINPIKFFVGIIEIISEVAKVASLSFRLFGNVFAGEVLLTSIAVIFAFVLPIPFLFLEILVGIIQALIFAMLTLVYFSIASTAEEH